MAFNDLKNAILGWANSIGEKEAVRRLTNPAGPDISVSVATKLASGRYHAELGFNKGQAILRELAKDGFTLAGTEAS